MIEKENKEVELGTRKIRRGTITTNKVKRLKQTPLYPSSGNVSMSTNGRRYTFPNPYGAKQVMFYGIASRLTSAGFAFTTNTVTTIPVNGAIYEYADDTTITVEVTGNSGPNTIFVIPLSGDLSTLPTGRYERVSGTGNSFMNVTAVAAPGVDIRVDCFGTAQLRPSKYFTPNDEFSVGLAGEIQKIIQSGKWFLLVDENASGSMPESRARSIETSLVNIDWPNASTIVVRARVVDYGSDYFEVEVDLATNWILQGNFLCT